MPNDPFSGLPQVPWFTVQSIDFSHDEILPLEQRSAMFGAEGGRDLSPQLAWTGAPRGTKSFAVTMYDPDSPTGAGFWHWAVVDIQANVSSLQAGAGSSSSLNLPPHAYHLRNDAGVAGYVGGSPSAGSGEHRFFFVVHALDVRQIKIPPTSTPSFLGLHLALHIIGRAVIVATGADLAPKQLWFAGTH